MKLKNPTQTRRILHELVGGEKATIEEIAEAIPMSAPTVSKILRGQSVRYDTIKKIADFLKVNEEEIAEVVQ